MEKANREAALNVSSLKSRGWTDAGIRRFLADPDFTRSNPHYSSAAPMRFYLQERVEKVESSDEYKVWAERSAVRKAAASKAVEKKRDEMMEWAQSVIIEIPNIPEAKLRESAVDHYNCLQAYRETSKRAYLNSDDGFLDRLKVNYLRHCQTDYEVLLQKSFGKVGVDDAYEIIKERILSRIAEVYPDLAAECDEQVIRMQERFLWRL